MTKIRVHELAKELNVPNKEVMKKLEEMGIFVPNHMSTLAPAEEDKVRVAFGQKPVHARPAAPKKRVVVRKRPQADPQAEGAGTPESAKAAAPAKAEAPVAEPKAEVKPQEEPKAEVKEEVKQEPKAEAPKAAETQPEQPKAEEPKAKEPEKKEEPKTEEAPKKTVTRVVKRPALEGEIVRRADGKLVRRIAVPKGETAQSVMAKREAERRQNGDKEVEMTVVPNGSRNKQDGEGRRGRTDRPERGDRRQGEGRTDRLQRTDRRQGEGLTDRPERTGQDRQNRQGTANAQTEASRDNYRTTREAGSGRDNSRRRAHNKDQAQAALNDIIMPERPKTAEKPSKKSGAAGKKEKNRTQGADDFARKKNNARMQASMMDDDALARHRKKPKPKSQQKHADAEGEQIKMVALPDTMTVMELAEYLGKPDTMIIKALMMKGIIAGLNQQVEFEQAEEIAMDFGILVDHEVEEDIFASYANPVDNEEDLEIRPPVVVVMGHVDHGKTSLLDKIRSTRVTAGEAGGITQSIGASVVEIGGRKITFLDTPGHEAFTAMRLRGAQATDIAILVVAADDGVMPQTIEAISHAKTAGVQIIVAINKMDKPGANPDRVMQELTEYDLIPEAWGGSTICVPVSAITGEGIDTLLEMVLLTADMEEYKANPNAPASGVVIEAELDRGRGAVATVLVQRGTLHMGDPIVVGNTYGRIKAMQDDHGKRIKTAGPSMPAEIIGLDTVPAAGERFFVTPSDREARLLAEKVAARERQSMVEGSKRVSLEDLFGQIQEGNMKELNIVVKADTQGSVEAVKQSLEKLSNEEVAVRVIHGAVGAVNESDVTLAATANAIIVGFNVRPDAIAKQAAEQEKIDIRLYRVIYTAIEEIEAAMKGMLDPKFEEKIIGHAEVRQVFRASNIGVIAGSYVKDGKIQRGAQVRLVRDNIVIYEGELASLRRFKDDVREVATNYECGIMLNKFTDIKEGDIIEAFVMEEIER